jgi:glycosyltransferase involved in cell wall biosynthesis
VSRLRVLHVSHTSVVSGAEHSLLDLAAHLGEVAAVAVAAPRGDLSARAQRLGLRTLRTPGVDASFSSLDHRTARALRTAAAAVPVFARALGPRHRDVVHANSVRAGLLVGPTARARGTRMVVHVRDVLPPTRAAWVLRMTMLGLAHSVVAVSHAVRAELISGVPEQFARKVTVIDNPIDATRFTVPSGERRRQARRRLGLADGAPVIAIIGQITPWKGHDVAIRALEIVMRQHPDAVLLVAGSVAFGASSAEHANQVFRRHLDDLVAQRGLSESVRFLGECDDVTEVLAASTLLVAPSTFEPFGRSIAEAMMSGVPVIATRRGGPREYVVHGTTGWLLEPGAADEWARHIVGLLADPKRLECVAGHAARSAQGRFSSIRHRDAMLELLGAG